MRNKGFTIVEMIVVITIISILAALGTVQMLRSEAIARDKERADDVSAINLTFQDVYDNGHIEGNIVASGDASVTSAVVMGYPSTAIAMSAYSASAQTTTILQNIRLDALKSPYLASSAVSPTFSLVPATSNAGLDNTALTAGGVSLGTNNDVYVYQPLDSNGTVCKFATGDVTTGTGTSATTGKAASANQIVEAPRLANNCVKYNIFYFSEGQNAIIKVQSQKSSSDGLY
jgi:prepilin-type N-terminal cleavage/methylation domain-containing protein